MQSWYFPVKRKREYGLSSTGQYAEEVTGAEMECFECHKEVKGR